MALYLLIKEIISGQTSFSNVKMVLVFLAVLVSRASAQRVPCGGCFKIDTCVCDDAESTKVNNPRMCKNIEAKVVSCTCADTGLSYHDIQCWGSEDT